MKRIIALALSLLTLMVSSATCFASSAIEPHKKTVIDEMFYKSARVLNNGSVIFDD